MGVMRWVFAALAAMDLVLFVVMVIREPGGEEMWLDALGVLGMGALAAINVIVYRRHRDALAAQASGMSGP
ncbi:MULTISPECIES: hypothetical protein [unclassified Streptomyces]|uniref:hypothetical protein n=1 Tax=unclassified Streptomyces TaxID=2593676 RepID=UPI000DB9B2DA|nr:MULTISPECIES: hypothetical protein [unclassified Streptomyces]MYT68092.1 hypothetical protein [Streptomyces sp. SID8367]RAJ72655.1 hypothetical protein K377_07209 [Streptomyces sp. PsTaAH-137]